MKWRFIYRGLKAKYRFDVQEIKALVENLSPDDLAIDVGANKGSYLWSLSRAVPNGQVYAFEPQPIFSEYLKKICISANLQNVTVEACGVSDAAGVLTLAVPGSDPTSPAASFENAVMNRGPHHTYEVSVVRLDDYFQNETRHIGAIKIDVEGHELAVLRGALLLIQKNKPVIVCESENQHITSGRVEDVIQFILNLGYEGWFVHQGKLKEIKEFDSKKHQVQDIPNFTMHPDYCNNFVFKPISD